VGPGQGLTLRRPALALLFAAGAALAADATEPLPLPVVEIHVPSPCLGVGRENPFSCDHKKSKAKRRVIWLTETR
jgi:hypothetical protein